MNHPPKISIITPVWNGLPYLEECVESVLSQDVQDWEMIISDNGSTDGTRDYLRSLNDPRIKIYEQEKNLGIFGNINFLFSKATAGITQILCADDFLIPGALSKITEHWESVPSDVALLRWNWATRSGFPAHDLLPNQFDPKFSDLGYFLFGCAQGNLSNVSVRTHVIEECGWFDETLPYTGDFEFWSRMSRAHPWRFEEEIVTNVRRHVGQATHYLNRNCELATQMLVVKTKCFDRIKGKCNLGLLKLLGTWNYFRFIHQAVRILLLKGQFGPFQQVWKLAKNEMHLPRFLIYPLYLLTINGRFGNRLIVKALLKSWDSRNMPSKSQSPSIK